MKKAKKRAPVRKVKKSVAKKRRPTAAQLAYYARNKSPAGRRKYAASDEKKRQTALANAHSHTAETLAAERPESLTGPCTDPSVGNNMAGAAFDPFVNVSLAVSTATAVQEGATKSIVLSHGGVTFRMEASDSLIFKLGMDCLRLVPAPRT